ncbi:hypothetical protein [Streptomyces sp. NPDC018610]|uniref:hypothetical protein n=1 Tax=Streptomyces sp. NPDC018610 TaxID=3365049 RepID=UPI0037A33AEF
MTKLRRTRAAAGALPAAVAVVAVLAAGCGTQRPDDDAGGLPGAARTGGAAATSTATAVPSKPSDFPCPGESPTPTPSPTASHAAEQPPDHYAENHGFRVPIPLHGQSRCDGLAAVARIEKALEPLRRRGDFAPESTRKALTGLGYADGKVQSYQNGNPGVGFLIVDSPLCLEGTMYRNATRADAFAGYPDGSDCQPPSGGH